MNEQYAALFIFIVSSLLFTLPGIFLMRLMKGADGLTKVIATPYFSIAFWIGVSWFISWVGLPLGGSVLALLGLAGLFLLVQIRKWNFKIDFNFWQIPLHHYALIIAIVLLCTPLTFLSLPPGCDTTMHGYITRLIINSNGLPHSYHPILPVGYFGSYSAGYHVLTALLAGLKLSMLRHAINFIAVITYPLALMGIVFFMKQLFTNRVAIYTSILFWGLNSTLQSTIGWGGNPTMLAFGCCLFAAGLLMHALQKKDTASFLLSSLPVAAILLIHAIPAICFIYIALPGFVVCYSLYADRRQWMLKNALITGLLTIAVCLPFILHFKFDSTPELTLKIKQWQLLMMNNKFSPALGQNIANTLLEIGGRIGELPIILSAVGLIVLCILKKFKEIAIFSFFLLYLFVMVINYGYWFLPLSELLYPERIVFFIIIALAIPVGYALEYLWDDRYAITLLGKRFHPHMVPLMTFLVIAIAWINNGSNSLRNGAISANTGILKAIDWINQHAEPNALLVASYNDVGMWLPTFTNRVTLGCHMHFIHEIMHLSDTLEASNAPRYIFITKRDLATNAPILVRVQQRPLVFSNSEVYIYH